MKKSVASLVVVKYLDDYLMVKAWNKYEDTGARVLGMPCGKIDEGESPIQAAVRELEEETGLSVSTQDLRYIKDLEEVGGALISCYIYEAPVGSLRPDIKDTEECQVIWMKEREILNTTFIHKDFTLDLISTVNNYYD